jgi:hypothetical protein
MAFLEEEQKTSKFTTGNVFAADYDIRYPYTV